MIESFMPFRKQAVRAALRELDVSDGPPHGPVEEKRVDTWIAWLERAEP